MEWKEHWMSSKQNLNFTVSPTTNSLCDPEHVSPPSIIPNLCEMSGSDKISKALSELSLCVPPGKGCRRQAVSKMVLNPYWLEQCELSPQMAGLGVSATWKNSLSPWMGLSNLGQG